MQTVTIHHAAEDDIYKLAELECYLSSFEGEKVLEIESSYHLLLKAHKMGALDGFIAVKERQVVGGIMVQTLYGFPLCGTLVCNKEAEYGTAQRLMLSMARFLYHDNCWDEVYAEAVTEKNKRRRAYRSLGFVDGESPIGRTLMRVQLKHLIVELKKRIKK